MTFPRRPCLALCTILALTLGLGLAAQAQEQTLTLSGGAANDFFSLPVAISGNILVAGATADDVTIANQGSVRVFVRAGGVWTEQQMLTGDPTVRGFGGAVALGGNTLFVRSGADNGGRGAVYVFTEHHGVWTQQQLLTASDGRVGDGFGTSLAFNGNTLVVGAMGVDGNRGAAYVFNRSGGDWIEQQKLIARDRLDFPAFPFQTFGRSVAVQGDTIVVGRPFNGIGGPTPPGSAIVFVRIDGTWIQVEGMPLAAANGSQTDNFGDSLALNGDTLAVGAKGADSDRGAVYVFHSDGVAWSQLQKLQATDGISRDVFGTGLAMSGGTMLVGASAADVGANENQGAAYVFTLNDGLWAEQAKLAATAGGAGDLAGLSVDLSGDTLVVSSHLADVAGNPNQGAVYLFSRSSP